MQRFHASTRSAHVSCLQSHQLLHAASAGRTSTMAQAEEPALVLLQHLAQRLHEKQQEHNTDSCQQAGPPRMPKLATLELYSGLGGMHYSLTRCLGPDAQAVVHAVDINPVANKVYAHNFNHPPRALNLEHCTVRQLDELAAELWTMSPPCQPFTTTTQSRRMDTKDARANSYVHLLTLLPQLQQPPQYIFLENVEGFIDSEGHALLLGTLQELQYSVTQFLLSPHQYGIPNLRPRYFMLAKHAPQQFLHPQLCQQGVQRIPPPLPFHLAARCMPPSLKRQGITLQAYLQPVELHQGSKLAVAVELKDDGTQLVLPRPCVSGLACDAKGSTAQQETSSVGGVIAPTLHTPAGTEHCYPLHLFLESSEPGVGSTQQGELQGHLDSPDVHCVGASNSACVWSEHALGHADLRRFWKVLDVVTPDSRHTNCVTKNYGRNILGAGSLLATHEFAQAFCRVDERGRTHIPRDPYQGGPTDDPLLEQIRYLTPREVARLMGLPEACTQQDTSTDSCSRVTTAASFGWPAESTRLQVLALLGNSLSCDCVSWLLAYLMMEPGDAQTVNS